MTCSLLATSDGRVTGLGKGLVLLHLPQEESQDPCYTTTRYFAVDNFRSTATSSHVGPALSCPRFWKSHLTRKWIYADSLAFASRDRVKSKGVIKYSRKSGGRPRGEDKTQDHCWKSEREGGGDNGDIGAKK